MLAHVLHEATDTLLQFLETRAEQPAGLEDPLVLGAARCLGRCLASYQLSTIGSILLNNWL